ncbi:hypothetical protein DY000_02022706 [Brassica cretica]|uniref:Uncharacterized protein n=1 Tax=Brassica cretica TaxID=69181 RepID=A0ABQ7ENT3_BRACR|nr:hypothetical protein DY000_02022706 [Brassica cretica]
MNERRFRGAGGFERRRRVIVLREKAVRRNGRHLGFDFQNVEPLIERDGNTIDRVMLGDLGI